MVVDLLVHLHGVNAPDELELAHRPRFAREGEHRRRRPAAGNLASGETALAEDDDALSGQVTRRQDRRGGDRLGDLQGARPVRRLDVVRTDFHRVEADRLRGVLREVVALRLGDDPVHRLDRLERVAPGGALAGEHHRVGAVEHRVGHVRGLCPGRTRMLDHRLQHLGRDDHRTGMPPTGLDDPLLHDGHLVQGDLHSQVAARDHHPVGLEDDLVEVVERPAPFELGDDLQRPARLARCFPHLDHVRRRTDVARREKVGVLLHRHPNVVDVLRGNPERQMTVRQVDALAARHGAADDDLRLDHLLVLRADLQLHPAVVYQNLLARLDVRDHVPVERQIHLRARAQADHVALLEHPRPLEVIEPVAGSHQVDHHTDRPADLLADLPYETNQTPVFFPGAVGLVQPDDVDAGTDQTRESLLARTGRADRGNDLGSTLHDPDPLFCRFRTRTAPAARSDPRPGSSSPTRCHTTTRRGRTRRRRPD